MSQYKPGGNFPTVSVTNGSATVTVLGVDATAEIDVGDSFFVNGAYSGRYDVGARVYSAPNTVVTLTAPYVGATNAGAIGVFHRDFTSGMSLPLPYDGDLEFAALNRRQMEVIDQFFQNPIYTATFKAQYGGTNGISLLAGADSAGSNNTITNNVDKIGRIACPHRSTSEEPLGLILGSVSASASIVSIGGGSSWVNSATEVGIYTGANTTTQSGTRRTYWNSAGRMLVGEPTDDSVNLAQFNGRVKATGFSSRGVNTAVADDTALVVVPPTTNGVVMIVGTNVGNAAAIVWIRPNATPVVNSLGIGSSVSTTSGILTGTTGTDGRLTISAHTDGQIYIENRLGSAVNLNYTFVSLT